MESDEVLNRPIFIVGPPNPAQAVLAESLLRAPGTWDAERVVDGLGLGEPPGDVRTALVARFAEVGEGQQRFDQTPRLVAIASPQVRVSLLVSAFPDAYFVYLHRDPLQDPATPVQSWAEHAATTLDDLTEVAAQQWTATDQADLIAEPETEVQRLFAVLDLGWHQASSQPWREASANPPPPSAGTLPEELVSTLARVQGILAPAPPSLAPTTTPGSLSASDDGLGRVLEALESSVLVTTYQSNRMVVLRHDGDALGVHLRAFDRPMGISLTPQGFALGVRSEVLDYRNFAAVAHNLEPVGKHDACFLPRNSHVTGDIAVHDLALGRDGMWVVATNFSCLATLDVDHSFVPRWKPPFISELAPEDRCHLNGLAMVDGVPRYVTALGVANEKGGWRPDKATGGVLMEVPSGKVLVEGLSMPHSPRWHEGKLYLLESGRGRLVVCDLAAGTTQTVAQLPGFARGLSFFGGGAFVGTSQIRETATFGGVPIAELPTRECGVWAVELASGKILGAVRFHDRIEEIFDVSIAPGVRFPEIVEQGHELTHTAWYVPPLSQGAVEAG